jgi:hypothetical protein
MKKVYIASFSLGMGSVPWVIMSEVELAFIVDNFIKAPNNWEIGMLTWTIGFDADIPHKYERDWRKLRDSGELVQFIGSFFRLQLSHELEFFR